MIARKRSAKQTLARVKVPVLSNKSSYFATLLNKHNLGVGDALYFEHNPEAVRGAESIGIKSYRYDKEKKDLGSLKEFLEENL